MSNVDPSLLILLVLAGLGIISHNMTVTLAMIFLLVIKITPLNQYFPLVEKYGMTIGILILTVGVMTPIATGRISAQEVFNSFKLEIITSDCNWHHRLLVRGTRGVTYE